MLVLVAPVALVACGGDDGGDEDPEQVLRDTFGNDEQVSSGTIDITIDGSVEGTQAGSGEASLSGSFQGDESDPMAFPQFDLTASLSGEAAGTSASFEGGLTATEDNMYIEYQGQTYEVGTELFSAFTDSYEQAVATAAAGATGEEGATSASFDEQCATLLEQVGGNTDACDTIDVFSWFELSNEGTEDVEGTESIHIHGDVDLGAMIDNVNAAIEASEIPGAETITEEEKAQAEEALSELSFDVYSSSEDNLLTGFDIDATIDAAAIPDASTSGVESVTAGLGTRLGSINEDQTIEAPADAQPIDDLLSQFGLSAEDLEAQLGQVSQLGLGGVPSTDFGGSDLGGSDLGGGDDLGLGGSGGGGGGGGTGGVDADAAQQYLQCIAESKTPQDFQDCEKLAP
jgi:hypothetical protein